MEEQKDWVCVNRLEYAANMEESLHLLLSLQRLDWITYPVHPSGFISWHRLILHPFCQQTTMRFTSIFSDIIIVRAFLCRIPIARLAAAQVVV